MLRDRPHFGDSSCLAATAAQSFLCQPAKKGDRDENHDEEE